MKEETIVARRKRAAKAVKNFNRMIPGLRSYARNASGNPTLKLQAGKNSQTDGKTIWIAPPLSLGYDQVHNGMCNSRADGKSVCPACATREELVEVLHHEIGHIIHGSFDKWNYAHVDRVLLNAELKGTEHSIDPDFLAKVGKSARDHGDKPLIVHVNAARHPWLSLIMLVMEDARCDEARMRFNPAEREVFDALNQELLIEGCHYLDGTIKHYNEMDRDTQACLAFLYSTRVELADLEGYFDDEVFELISEPRVRKITEAAIESPDTVHSFELSLQLLALYNELGFCSVEGKDDDELSELIKELSKLLVLIVGHGLDLDKSAGGGGAGGRASEEGSEMGHGLRPEDIEAALEAMATLDRVPVNVGPPKVYKAGEGSAYAYDADSKLRGRFKSQENILTPALTSARIAFSENAKATRQRNQRSGRVSGRVLAKRVPFGDDRLFAKKIQPDRRNYAVLIGMDVSGSTSGQTLTDEKFAVLAMADVLQRLGIQFEIWAHSTGWDSDYMDYPELYEIKGASDTWNDKSRENLRRLNSCGANLDGHTLQFYRKRLESMQATDRVLMYYTDGAMPATNYDEELMVLKSEIAYCNKHDITLMAVGMGVDTPKRHGFDTCQVDSSADYRKVVDHLGKRLR